LQSGLAGLVHAAKLPPLKEKQRASGMLARCVESVLAGFVTSSLFVLCDELRYD
jgi:hypothetical protein